LRRARSLLASLLLLPALAGLPPVRAQGSESFRKMNRPVEPFRIVGNLYYVGASDVACYLIVTPEGHVLIDGGFEETVPIILHGIETLGFRVEDVRILLNSHAHLDHAGGLARLAELSGARVMASEGDAPLLERGGRGDPLLGDDGAFPPVEVDRRLRDGDTVELGGTTLTARITPGHTPGCTTWVTEIEEGGRRYRVVSVGSVTVLPGTRFGERPTYEGIAADYARSFEILKSLRPDVFLASHGSFFHMQQKRARLEEGAATNPFVDPEGYRAFVERFEGRFLEALEREDAAARGAGDEGS